MNRRDLAKELTTTFDPPLSFRDADATLKFVFDEIGKKLVGGDEVSIPGFGRWKVRQTAAGMRRNPQTQEMIKVPASQKVRFYPATALKAEVAGGRGGRRAPRAARK
ncbi:MAG TPA: HU family DNA-binding protein [Candidatus Micrarchaeia archaeon]|nr:HU family DNA-binding protein [Candidatus Micrarchaeia archaeon]